MKVGILMGSANDKEKVAGAAEMLGRFGIEVDERVLSAHRNPDEVADFAKSAKAEGFGVIICAAGMAAALPGVVAALTTIPVIGLPLSASALNGVDALYSIVQMPPGIPVACVAVDGAKNAGILAAQILALSDENIAAKLAEFRAGGSR
jgi:5-(carboxyamino)imidazole ribonucleotide mutase